MRQSVKKPGSSGPAPNALCKNPSLPTHNQSEQLTLPIITHEPELCLSNFRERGRSLLKWMLENPPAINNLPVLRNMPQRHQKNRMTVGSPPEMKNNHFNPFRSNP